MLKRWITSITAFSMILAICVTPAAAKAEQYEYTYSFTKHGFTETMWNGESVYAINGGTNNADIRVNVSQDDDGQYIPAQAMKYARVSYYIDAKSTSAAQGATFYTQVQGMTFDGAADKPSEVSGFINLGALSTVGEWAYAQGSLEKISDYAESASETYQEIYVTNLQLRPFWSSTLAVDETVYLKDITFYNVADPNRITADDGTLHKVTFYTDDSKTEIITSQNYTSNIAEFADVITMPDLSAIKEGFTFIGWKKTNVNTVYPVGSSYTFVDGKDLEFIGVWLADEVYVSAAGNDAAFGTQDAPVATLKRAVELLGADRGGTIWIEGEIAYQDVPEHTGKITISSKTGGTLTAQEGINLSGETKFSDIKINNAVATYANRLEMENVIVSDVALGGDLTVGGNGVPPQNECAVLNGGTYANVYFGGEDTSSSYGAYTGTDTLYIENGANTGTVYIGHSTSHDQLFAGDVNLVVNNAGVGSVTDAERAIGWVAGAVQVLANYGSSIGEIDISTTSISFGRWIMNSDETGGLDVTGNEGEFTVNDGKTAVATNHTTHKVYHSANGLLKVPEGTYSVSYLDSPVYTYSDDMQSLTVETAFCADFEIIEHKELEGKLFLGWRYADGNAPANQSTLSAGTILYAHYTDFDTNAGGDFYVQDYSEIRQAAADEEPALRFFVCKSNAVQIPDANYGTIVLPKVMVQNSELVIGGQYEYPYGSGNYYSPENVPAFNTYVEEKDYIKYTLCITNIPEAEYIRDLTVRGYVTFTDDNGILKTAYTKKMDNNMYETAKTANKTELTNAARAAYDAYGTTPVGYRAEYQTTANETAYQTNYSGILFMETTIDTGLNLEKPIEIISFGDQHFKYMNALDRENPEIMYAAKKRKDNTNPIRRHYQAAQNVMEYASMFDYTMLVGDTIDFFSYGSLDVAKDVLFDKSPDSLVALGYHDYVVYTINGRSASEFDQEAAKDVLRQYYPNDITYASYDLPNAPIRIVYMDDSRNGQFYYSDGIVEQFAADIQDAREKGRKILVMKHEGTCTNNENETTVQGFICGDGEGTMGSQNEGKQMNYLTCGGNVWFNMNPAQANYDQVKGTRQIYELLFHNADVISAVLHGHVHANYITEIQADYTDENGNVVQKNIPQYSSMLNGSFDYGMGIKIKIQ